VASMPSSGSEGAGVRRRLFVLSNLAIFMIGLGFAVRANIAADLQGDIFDVLDLSRSAAMVGEVLVVKIRCMGIIVHHYIPAVVVEESLQMVLEVMAVE